VTRLEWLTYDRFAPRVGEVFEVGVGAGPTVCMVLSDASESAEPGGRGPEGQERLQFSLVFRGPATPALPQGTYRLTHPELGELAMFLVPLGPDPRGDGPGDAQGMRYEAVFA
jgi:hypothetical protein